MGRRCGRGWGGRPAEKDSQRPRGQSKDFSNGALPDRSRHIKFGGDDE